jgi:hypothetical protein
VKPRRTASASRRRRAPRALRATAFLTLSALLVEFLLGVATNLYVTVPAHQPWTRAHPALLLYAHGAVGLVLLANSVVFQARAIDLGSRHVVRLGAVGVTGTGVASASGALFVSGGGVSDIASLVMSVGFALAVLAYAAVLLGPSRPR